MHRILAMPPFPGAHQIFSTARAVHELPHKSVLAAAAADHQNLHVSFEENQERYGVPSNSVNLDSPVSHRTLALPARVKVLSSHFVHSEFALILLVLARYAHCSAGGVVLRRLMEASSTTKADRLVLYASTIAFQWIAVALILWRTHAHNLLPASLGLAIPKPGLALITGILLSALILVEKSSRCGGSKSIPKAVRTGSLRTWPSRCFHKIPSSASALQPSCRDCCAICEGLIYRGFAQRVFQDWATGWVGATIAVGIGVVGSAIMFSLAHLYQGRRGLV